eukprot:TRINITY_DN18754_c0_g1_i1.p1 TRINITY_DN18754_c0_g1~~TRINITY_DN18754_c0_g1_i1.p1  ORF type:complete len:492 (+),score=89.97 TRINITY_DN18754_c0_g1_i1:37-1476(+)
MVGVVVGENSSLPLLVNINEVLFNGVVICPPNRSCHFSCNHQLAACLGTHFVCNQTNYCAISCMSINSCIWGSISSSPDSTYSINCEGEGSCSYWHDWDLLCPTCTKFSSISGVASGPGNLRKSFGPVVTKAFALNGVVLDNYIFSPDLGFQLLSEELPIDNETLQTFLKNLSGDIRDIIHQVNVSGWDNFPDFEVRKTEEYIITLVGDPSEALKWSFQNYLNNFNIPGLTVKSAIYRRDSTLMYFNTPFSLKFYFGLLAQNMKPYFRSIFNYPNNSFVSITLNELNPNLVEANVTFYPMHCSYPVPFWGTFCLDTVWYSEGNLIISTKDLIQSETSHFGSFQVDSTSLLVINTLFNSTDLLVNSGKLDVASSTIHLTNGLTLTDSTLVIQNNNITAQSLSLGDNMNLFFVKLEEKQESRYYISGSITVDIIKTTSVSGNFSTIQFVGSKGNIQGCTSTLFQNHRFIYNFLLLSYLFPA